MGKRGFCCHYNDGVETGIVYFYVIHSDIIKAYMIYNLRVFSLISAAIPPAVKQTRSPGWIGESWLSYK